MAMESKPPRGQGIETSQAAYIAPGATITGDVRLGKDASVWHGAVLRGDMDAILVGARSNIQDGAVVHVSTDAPCVIGDDVTVGHGAIVHACTIGDRCLVGMGSIILDGARIGEESIVGAGALVTGRKEFPPRSMILGSPAKAVRQLEDADVEKILHSAEEYVGLAVLAGKAPAASPVLSLPTEQFTDY